MLFHSGKCNCLHIGPGNTGMNYEMGGTILSKTVKEKDLGVTMNANLNVSVQCRISASMGKKGSFYIAQYPVRWTAQSALHFLPPLADLFIPAPTRILPGKSSSQAAITRQG